MPTELFRLYSEAKLTLLPSGPIYLRPSGMSHAAQSPALEYISSAPAPPGFLPSAPLPTSHLGVIPTAPAPTNTKSALITSQGNGTGTLPMQSTDQGLKPIPPAATQIGDPNGHHEITEPDFSATRPCVGCSPVIEMTATGWLDIPVGEQHDSTNAFTPEHMTSEDPQSATISASPTKFLVGQAPDGGDIVIGESYTLTPGQTITTGDTHIGIQTSGGNTEVVIGTAVIPMQSDRLQTTDMSSLSLPDSLPPIITIGNTTITPNAQSQYVLAEQTLIPGGKPITVSGTIVSLAPSATALVMDGKTSNVVPAVGGVYTTVIPAALTFHNEVYTTNRAGYIMMGLGTTLIPGGNPVTIDGTILSLDPSGIAIVIQGTKKTLEPVTTVVTLTRDPNALETSPGTRAGDGADRSTSNVYFCPTAQPTFAGAMRYQGTTSDGWLATVRRTMMLEIRRWGKMALDKRREDGIQQIYFEHVAMAHGTTST
ncbi:hypothetical protein DDE82_005460 [Stemphylium lycopersici]|nr:hypothetical protein DDE82_005460 [Stemphylium lycopersici]